MFEVECFGTVYAAKEIHSILVQQEEFEAAKKAFLTECVQSCILEHSKVVQVLGVYNPGGQSLLLTSSGDGADAGEPCQWWKSTQIFQCT